MAERPGQMKPRVLRLEISRADAGKTIKEYLMKKTGLSSRQLSRFKYRKDGILLNGEKRYVNAVLREGDLLEIRLTQGGEPVEEGAPPARRGASGGGYAELPDGRLQKIWAPPAAWLAQEHPLRILYEDQDILAADKPSGVVCHPSPGHYDDTLSNQVAEHLGKTGQELDVRVTGRLDRDTSGIVIFALNTETAALLIRQRQTELMNKLYIARVRGHFPDDGGTGNGSSGGGGALRGTGNESSGGGGALRGTGNGSSGGALRGTVDRPLRRESAASFRMVTAEDGKAARTHYEVLAQLPDLTSILACRIEHGRTHQIRVHLASIGHPIVGDCLYGPESGSHEENETAGPLMLHAFRAGFRQPFTGEEIRIEAPLPEWASRAYGADAGPDADVPHDDPEDGGILP